jgi:hypothetical protein
MRMATLSHDNPLPTDTGLGVAAPGSDVTSEFPSFVRIVTGCTALDVNRN